MDYIIKPHARGRMAERKIPESLIDQALRNPTQIGYDAKNRTLIKKLYKHDGRKRLLLIAGEMKGNILEVITVIDTSKIKKYL